MAKQHSLSEKLKRIASLGIEVAGELSKDVLDQMKADAKTAKQTVTEDLHQVADEGISALEKLLKSAKEQRRPGNPQA